MQAAKINNDDSQINNFSNYLTLAEILELTSQKENKPNLITSIEQIFNIISIISNDSLLIILKFLYKYVEIINQILCDQQKIILFESKYFISNEKIISKAFYLILLVNSDVLSVWYTYEIDLIQNLINILDYFKNDGKIYKLLILSKITNECINGYENSQAYDEQQEVNINKYKAIINEYISLSLNEINKNIKIKYENNEILEDVTVEDLYCIIIDEIFIIFNNDDNNFENIEKILIEIEVEDIDLTIKLQNKIIDKLNINEDYIKKYMINEVKDIFDERKNNFYYLIIKYLIKDKIKCINIEFIRETKKAMISILNNEKILHDYFNNNNNEINNLDKIEYNIKSITNDNYFQKLENYFLSKKKFKLDKILNYYKYFKFKTKKNEIIEIEKILQDFNDNKITINSFIINHSQKYAEYLKDYVNAEKYEYNGVFIYNCALVMFKKLNEDKMEHYIKNWDLIVSKINNKQYILRNDLKNKLIMLFNEEKNKENLRKLFSEDIINSFLNHFNSGKCNINGNIIKKVEEEKNMNDESSEQKINDYSDAPNYYMLLSEEEKMNANIKLMTEIIGKIILIYNNMSKNFTKINYGNNKTEINYEKLKELEIIFKNINNNQLNFIEKNKKLFENYVKLITIMNSMKEKLNTEYKNNYELTIKIKFIKNEIKNKDNINIFNIDCLYTFYTPNNNIKNSAKKLKFRDKNIILNGPTKGFLFLLNEINSEKYKINLPNSPPITPLQKDKLQNDINSFNEINNSNNISNFFVFPEEKKDEPLANKYQIINFLKTIGVHEKGSADKIINLTNGCSASCGSNKELIIYDEKNNQKIIISDFDDWLFNINEKNPNQIIICSNQEVSLVDIDYKNESYRIRKYFMKDLNCYSCTEMKKNNFIICSNKFTFQYNDLFEKVKDEVSYTISKIHFRNSIKITENIIAMTSNKILNNGSDCLIFYNVNLKKISLTIDNYSFITSPNGILLIKNNNNFNIILCACKKYLKDQKNGILLVNPQIQENQQVENPFYPTKYFEVYCFCLLDKNFFLVGGFDNRRGEGAVRLYEIFFENKAYKTNIKFRQNIIINSDDNEFKGPITSIVQNKNDGKILMTCLDGTVNLFTRPNLEYYYDNVKKN